MHTYGIHCYLMMGFLVSSSHEKQDSQKLLSRQNREWRFLQHYLLPRQRSSSAGLQKPTCQLSLVKEPIANFSSVPLNATSCGGSNLKARFHFAPGNSSSAATTLACASTWV